MYIHMDSGNMILFRKAKEKRDDIHEELEDTEVEEVAEAGGENEELSDVDENEDDEEGESIAASLSSMTKESKATTEDKHALELSHNDILEGLYWLWKNDDVANPEFNRLCIVYKNRFGEDPTVGMLDFVEKHIRWGDVKPLDEESKEQLLRLMV